MIFFMMIVPQCKKCKISGEYFHPVDKRKEGDTWFRICMCPKCFDILEVSWSGTTDKTLMEKRWGKKMFKKKMKK